MSADFWASYVSGAVGILIGNRLDVLKVKAQASTASSAPVGTLEADRGIQRFTALFRGAAAPILGYGALNSILFMSFNRSVKIMDPSIFDYTKLAGVDLSKIWVAGAIGGLATFVVSAPSELIKCRAQLVVDGKGSSYGVFKDILKHNGFRGLYYGGTITALRDSIGYGWYFFSYELTKRLLLSRQADPFVAPTASEVLVSGGIAGVVTWLSIYPLDVVKTRLQTQPTWAAEREQLLPGRNRVLQREQSSVSVARSIWQDSGVRGFYRGIGICSLRAFIVNAVQVQFCHVDAAWSLLTSQSGMRTRESWRILAVTNEACSISSNISPASSSSPCRSDCPGTFNPVSASFGAERWSLLHLLHRWMVGVLRYIQAGSAFDVLHRFIGRIMLGGLAVLTIRTKSDRGVGHLLGMCFFLEHSYSVSQQIVSMARLTFCSDLYLPSLVVLSSSVLVQVVAVGKIFGAFDAVKGSQRRQIFRGFRIFVEG
jgi:solute carrier family 25 (mitochondrial carnitine/acylcarnitine transporter), member 20/29